MKEIDLLNIVRATGDENIIPIVEELVNFVIELKPVIESINSSIEENISKMPTATKKLSKVTEATEVATQEIMDVVDGIFKETDSININLKNISAAADKSEIEKNVVSANLTLNNINNNLTSIMMALQVQDITAQQIAAVNHLLNSIQDRLGSIIKGYHSSEFIKFIDTDIKQDGKEDNITMMHRKIAFDPDAINALSSKKSRQADVDEMMQKHANGTITEDDMKEEISEDDIDKMFANSSENGENSINGKTDTVSQDDIDALFSKM